MKYRCRASEAGSVEAGRPAAHRFFFANRVDGAFVGQPNRASCQVAQPVAQVDRGSQGGRSRSASRPGRSA